MIPAAVWVERTWRTDDGLQLCARDYPGAGGAARLPVICLHGLTRNARDFEAVAPAIAAGGRRVLACDVRGRGRSNRDPQPERYAVPTYAGDVLALARAAGIARCVMVGTSMGGLIAMALALAAPGLIASAVLNDIGPRLAPEGLARIGRYTGEPVAAETWAEAAAYARRTNAAAFPDYAESDWQAFARRLFREEGGRPVLDYDPAIALPIRAAQGRPAPEVWPMFDALAHDRPLLAVRGALSDLLEADTLAQMQARAPDLRAATVEGVGHAPMLTEPAAAAALAAFLAEVD